MDTICYVECKNKSKLTSQDLLDTYLSLTEQHHHLGVGGAVVGVDLDIAVQQCRIVSTN